MICDLTRRYNLKKKRLVQSKDLCPFLLSVLLGIRFGIVRLIGTPNK